MNKKCIRIPTGPVNGLQPTEFISVDALESGEPRERGSSFCAGRTSQLDAGVWECEPNRHRVDMPIDEFVYLLAGRIDVIAEDGGTEVYKTGDSFMVPRGCRCIWDVKEPVRMLFVVPAAGA